MLTVGKSRRAVRGFTLVELLVVVAIIALLLSILLPSLQAAREHSKQSKCGANLHDLMGATFAYANSDKSGQLIPILPTLRYTSDVSASRRAWGGKSGLHDILRPSDNPPSGYAMFSTRNGFGPYRRPLNRVLYKNHGFRTLEEAESLTLEDARKDERLEYEVFKCPSDVGYQDGLDGTTGIFLYGGTDASGADLEIRDYKETNMTMYDVTGNSYATDSLMTGSGGTFLHSWGSYGHKYDHYPRPSLQYVFLESNAFYACFWNMAALGNVGGANDLEGYYMGWHGKLRHHMASYADGHVALTPYEVSTDVVGANSNGTLNHNGQYVKRGGTATDLIQYNGGNSGLSFTTAISFLVGGDGWVNHSQTVPPEVIQF